MKNYKQEIYPFLKKNLKNKLKAKGDIIDKVLDFMVENEIVDIDKVRNTMIIKDNDKIRSGQDKRVIEIYDDLAFKYDLSPASIKTIVRNRKENEIDFK